MTDSVHVVQTDNGWGPKTQGSSRVSKEYSTQEQAIKVGRKQAKRNNSELLIHDRKGKIRERSSYGNDPEHRKG